MVCHLLLSPWDGARETAIWIVNVLVRSNAFSETDCSLFQDVVGLDLLVRTIATVITLDMEHLPSLETTEARSQLFRSKYAKVIVIPTLTVDQACTVSNETRTLNLFLDVTVYRMLPRTTASILRC